MQLLFKFDENLKQIIMAGILFPTGMKATEVEDESIFMVYKEKTADGQPRIIKAKDLLKYLTGSVSAGNNKFPTGDAISVLFENTVKADEELAGNLAQFSSTGELVSGGNFDQFIKAFTDGLTKESIFR